MNEQVGQRGFTLLGTLIGLLLSSLLLSAGLSALSQATQTQNQQDLALEMEQNLRVAVDIVGDSVRMAGSGIPTSNLDQWISWVTSFDQSLLLTTGPTTLSEAHCTPFAVLSIDAVASVGDTVLAVASEITGSALGDLVDTSAKRLIAIDDDVFAHIVGVDAVNGQVTIDTDPLTAGDQGLPRIYAAGTPICRVDVTTFEVATDPTSGRSVLGMHSNDGASTQFLADGIIDIQVTELAAGQRYEVAIHAKSERPDPTTSVYLERTLRRVATLRNPF